MNNLAVLPNETKKTKHTKRFKIDKKQLEAQSMVWPGLIFLLIFSYIPMYGLIIAFKDFNLIDGYFGSPWVGLEFFKEFLSYPRFLQVLRNSLAINIMQLFFSFPVPIVFALLLNEIKNIGFKRVVQTVSYLPHFVSWVIFGGLVTVILDPKGIINFILTSLKVIDVPVLFLGKPEYFWTIVVFAGVAKGFGWGSIIYLAAISGVDQSLYDAATVDGAGRFMKMWHVTLPSIKGTIVILLIFNISGIIKTGFDQVWMLHNVLNQSTSETIEVYVYKMGLVNLRYSFATAVGLSQSVVSIILLMLSNSFSRKISGESLY